MSKNPQFKVKKIAMLVAMVCAKRGAEWRMRQNQMAASDSTNKA